jgi:hypothetical protein
MLVHFKPASFYMGIASLNGLLRRANTKCVNCHLYTQFLNCKNDAHILLWSDLFSIPYCVYHMCYNTGILHFGHRIHLLIDMITTINRLSFIVYKLVQPSAYSYTVSLYSNMFRWWPPLSSGKILPQTINTAKYSLTL